MFKSIKNLGKMSLEQFSDFVGKGVQTLGTFTDQSFQSFKKNIVKPLQETRNIIQAQSPFKQISQFGESIKPKTQTEALEQGGVLIGNTFVDPNFVGALEKVGSKATKTVVKNIIPRDIETIFDEFSKIPKGVHVSEGTKIIKTPYQISDTIKNITKASGNVSFTRKTLKHLSEKGEEGKRLIKLAPEILKNPDEIRQGDLDNRFFITKSWKDIKKGRLHTLNLEVTQREGDIIVTSFQTDPEYLSNYELLWRSAGSQ